jgi:hypothetical protein
LGEGEAGKKVNLLKVKSLGTWPHSAAVQAIRPEIPNPFLPMVMTSESHAPTSIEDRHHSDDTV